MKDKLIAEMQKTFDYITAPNDELLYLGKDDVDYIFDEVLHCFMLENFDDYPFHDENGKTAEFEKEIACDIRSNFEKELLDWIDNNKHRISG